MIGVELKVRGMTEGWKYLRDLGRRCPRAGRSAMKELAERTVWYAKMAAPKDTGKLAQSIRAKRKGLWQITITAGGDLGYSRKKIKSGPRAGKTRKYEPNVAWFQEHGFTPHVIHDSQWMGNNPLRVPFVRVGKHTPFMKPAADRYLNDANISAVVNRKIAEVLR